MTDYEQSYYNKIFQGLKSTKVTDIRKNDVDFYSGCNIICDKAFLMYKNKSGLMFFCGNGASASMAEHMSHDWFQNGKVNTTTCAETSHITAISNDYSYDEVYSYRVKRILSEKDMLVGISSSGNSQNIVNAISAAKENGAFTVSISGMMPDNKIRQMADLNFYVPLEHYGEVESAHAVLLHLLLDYYLDKYMGGRH